MMMMRINSVARMLLVLLQLLPLLKPMVTVGNKDFIARVNVTLGKKGPIVIVGKGTGPWTAQSRLATFIDGGHKGQGINFCEMAVGQQSQPRRQGGNSRVGRAFVKATGDTGIPGIVAQQATEGFERDFD